MQLLQHCLPEDIKPSLCVQALHALAVTDARLLASDAEVSRMSETLAPYLKWTEEGGDDAVRRRGAEQLLCVLYIQASLLAAG